MRIVKKATGQIAEKDSKGFYVCGLKKDDKSKTAYKNFSTIEDAAIWLIENPEWGIRMNPNWSLIYGDIAIERDI